MKITRFKGLLFCVLAILATACSQYTLESGRYLMSVKLPAQTEATPMEVMITVAEQHVTIKQADQTTPLTGMLEGNKLIINERNDSDQVRFQGKLIANNRVEGDVIQAAGDTTRFSATFTITKAAESNQQ